MRYAKTEVDLDILQEVIDKARTGLPGPPVPLSNAKRQLAMIWASKAVTGVACGDVYGRLDSVSLQTIGSDVGRMLWGQDLMWSFKRGEVGAPPPALLRCAMHPRPVCSALRMRASTSCTEDLRPCQIPWHLPSPPVVCSCSWRCV